MIQYDRSRYDPGRTSTITSGCVFAHQRSSLKRSFGNYKKVIRSFPIVHFKPRIVRFVDDHKNYSHDLPGISVSSTVIEMNYLIILDRLAYRLITPSGIVRSVNDRTKYSHDRSGSGILINMDYFVILQS